MFEFRFQQLLQLRPDVRLKRHHHLLRCLSLGIDALRNKRPIEKFGPYD